MPSDTYCQVTLSVEGIQAYLFATGKLREMIGASKLTSAYPDELFRLCEKLELSKVAEPQQGRADWYVVLQNGAGMVRLLVPEATIGRALLEGVGLWQVEHFPGMPLYGTLTDCAWTIKGLREAREQDSKQLGLKRATYAKPPMAVWPFCRVAPLDGLPAAKRDTRDKYLSAASLGRRDQALLKAANDAFRSMVEAPLRGITNSKGEPALPPDVTLCWVEDMDDMLQNARMQRLALLHMDGNDLGQQFRKTSEQSEQKSCAEYVKDMLHLSTVVDKANEEAFIKAMCTIVERDLRLRKKIPPEYIVPARPLVLGGDDLTIIIRADLAFHFADAYATAFQEATARQEHPMSVGGGMVIMPAGYPFTRAFALAEALTDNAKRKTAPNNNGNDKNAAAVLRPSSLDYVIITNDVERDLDVLREGSYQTGDGAALLTGKPFICGVPRTEIKPGIGTPGNYAHSASLANVLYDALWLRKHLAHSQLRSAIDACRQGPPLGQRAWQKLHENLQRGVGEGKNALPTFERIFPGNFFLSPQGKGEKPFTLLGDYLELGQLFDKADQEDQPCASA